MRDAEKPSAPEKSLAPGDCAPELVPDAIPDDGSIQR
jgi:hypothetical protein